MTSNAPERESFSGASLSDRLIGARIVSIEPHRNYVDTFVVEFEHRGTDDDSGYLLVDAAHVHFGEDDA